MATELVVYIGSQELAKISSLLPSNPKRSTIVHSLVNALGLMGPRYSNSRRLQVVTPRRATHKDLAVYHTRDYLAVVLDPSNATAPDGGEKENSVNSEFGLEDLTEYVQIVGGATLTAVSALQQDITDLAICWDGGRHHARKSQASGFCYVADCILAVLALKRAIPPSVSAAEGITVQRKPRVMYLDLDLHFSDAVSEAFLLANSPATPQILTLSIHHASPGFFPASSQAKLPDINSDFDPFTLSIPLQQGASASTYAKIWPLCGVDGLAGDPCATFNWCLGGTEGSLGWCVQRILQEWPGKKLLLGGGGYNSPNAARAWAYLTSIALRKPLDLETEIPDHAGFPLYGPSFTLDVPAGNMTDHNTEEYLGSIEVCYENVILALRNKLVG
ncbi:hypothetical protein NLJ89_g442 [Agrocybe chaxingu]|uniref:histone deacetylase n=1 Tax=Agrocybe chaxingu TaxID=84603 RepID=A0A9W8N1Y8_9AGAR|nr:hypothetical protein NLJ89_g442 [Agrocybe chaxingu]